MERRQLVDGEQLVNPPTWLRPQPHAMVAVSREDVFAALFQGARGFIELRAVAPGRPWDAPVPTSFSEIDGRATREAWIQMHATANLFFGLAARKSCSGALKHCLDVGCLWADLDFKTLPEEEARRLVQEFPIPPSLTIRSGYGAHAYWLLTHRYPVADPRLRRALLGLALALQGDRSVAELARVMRVPGSMNFKYDPPRPVVVTMFQPSRRVSLEDLLAILPAVPERAARNGSDDDAERVTLAPAAPMLTTCAFMRHCRDDATTLPEPEWHAMISNLARVEGGRALAHAWSAPYPTYSHEETEAKLDRALAGSGPITCAYISGELGFAGCPADSHGVKSPAALGFKIATVQVQTITSPASPDGVGGLRVDAVSVADHAPAPDAGDTSSTDAPWAIGAGQFLRTVFPPVETYIDPLLSSDGGGWLGGEEKLGKTFYAIEEALCLALELRVCGRFTVPAPRRVLFIEEEDSPRRTHTRMRALLCGHGLDPDDPDLQARLDAQFHLACWTGFTFDTEAWVVRLTQETARFQPDVTYIDVLRKVTLRDLNKADLASALLAILDTLRRTYRVLFRVVHHYRKTQGFRAGRGSQEIGGSFVLGAWGENSLFFEPIGRRQGAVKVETQTKDAAPAPAFSLKIEAEGPTHAPTLVRLHAEDVATTGGATDAANDEAVYQAVATLPPKPAQKDKGTPGVPREDIEQALGKSSATVRRSLNRLQDAERIVLTGTMSRGKKLYSLSPTKTGT